MVKIEEYKVLSGRTMTKPPMSRSSYITIFFFPNMRRLALASPLSTRVSLIGDIKRKENTITIHRKTYEYVKKSINKKKLNK